MHLGEQLTFLRASAGAFDAGFQGEAKRLAATVRLLVHDTKKSTSLLTQLGQKGTLFLDTAAPINPRNALTEAALVGFEMAPGGMRYWAPLDAQPYGDRRVAFDEWWGRPVIRDAGRNLFTRRDLILTAANQAGGAHVDPQLDEAYARLTRDNTMGWVATDGRRQRPILGVELATIRQIAHEALKTLDPHYTIDRPTRSTTMRNLTVEDLPHGPGAAAGKVGRNESCPCGSGKKFKRCHGA